MRRIRRNLLIAALAALPTGPAVALELFGVELQSTDRDALRAAVKTAGVELIREGGDDAWFDVYDSAAVLAGSYRLYLGFVKADGRFAFAEYEFVGLDARALLADLSGKYGEPETRRGRFLSDHGYRWSRDGVEIELAADWPNYRLRLSYSVAQNLAALQAERASPAETGDAKPDYSVY